MNRNLLLLTTQQLLQECLPHHTVLLREMNELDPQDQDLAHQIAYTCVKAAFHKIKSQQINNNPTTTTVNAVSDQDNSNNNSPVCGIGLTEDHYNSQNIRCHRIRQLAKTRPRGDCMRSQYHSLPC